MKKYITEIDIELYKKGFTDPIILANTFEDAETVAMFNPIETKVLGEFIESGNMLFM